MAMELIERKLRLVLLPMFTLNSKHDIEDSYFVQLYTHWKWVLNNTTISEKGFGIENPKIYRYF